MTLKACLKSMRLRTLPLSWSGVILGAATAYGKFNPGCMPAAGASWAGWPTFGFLLLTTALLQILSNLSNELGDTLHGTDTDDRQGMHYSLQDGDMTVPQMKRLIPAVAVLCCVSGLLMVWLSFGTLFAVEPICLLALGAAAVWAAVKYTIGKNPYGYRGLGDIFVFIFFGLVSVFGGYYVCSHDLTDLSVLIPASAIGCFSVGVLNVNNIRDMKSDAATRTTVAIRLGPVAARAYQTVLIVLGWALLILYTALTSGSGVPRDALPSGSSLQPVLLRWVFLMALPLFGLHLAGVWKRSDKALDPMLPLLVMSTFLTVLLLSAGLLLPAVLLLQ